MPPGRAKFDINNIPLLTGVSTADGVTPVPVRVDPATGAIATTGGGGGGGGGSVIVSNKLVTVAYDAIVASFTSTTDIYTFKSGGTGGTTVATVTVTYTDSTKAVISNVVRS